MPQTPDIVIPARTAGRRHALRTIAAAVTAPAAGTLAALAGPARAADWPSRTLRLIVGFPGGSTPDLTARALSEPLAQTLGQAVIVENRPGAGGNIAADLVAKATDDHTLGIVINGNLTSAKALFPKLPYDPERDLVPLSLLTVSPLVLVTNTDKPEGAAWFAAARASGDRWSYGSVGVGSLGHLGMELLMGRVSGWRAQHVPFNGNPQVLTALAAGEIQAALVPPGLALSQVRAGRVRAVGLTSTGRSTLAPELGTLAEAGLGAPFELEVWNGLVGPASLSRPARARLDGLAGRLVRDPGVRQKLFVAGWTPVGTTAEGFRDRVREETSQMARVIAARGIRLE
jgi:tripartite-type tricarboxylate transporter receptor subunit TctC